MFRVRLFSPNFKVPQNGNWNSLPRNVTVEGLHASAFRSFFFFLIPLDSGRFLRLHDLQLRTKGGLCTTQIRGVLHAPNMDPLQISATVAPNF